MNGKDLPTIQEAIECALYMVKDEGGGLFGQDSKYLGLVHHYLSDHCSVAVAVKTLAKRYRGKYYGR